MTPVCLFLLKAPSIGYFLLRLYFVTTQELAHGFYNQFPRLQTVFLILVSENLAVCTPLFLPADVNCCQS